MAVITRILALALALVALVANANAKTVTLKWTKGKLSASGGRLDHKNRALYVNSGDKVLFKWRGETMGLYGFYSEAHYKSCSKANLNYMKNTRGSGDFYTKANRSGWRYYAHISGAQDGACKVERKGCHKGVKGTCQSRVKIHWG